MFIKSGEDQKKMKHTLRVTLLLTGLFFLAQIIGLGILDGYLQKEEYSVGNVTYTNVTWAALPYGAERPEFEEKTSFLPVFGIILVATLLILVLMRFQLFRLWKVWFFVSVWFCLTVAFTTVMGDQVALILAGLLGLLKIVWKNVYVHNVTEIFIYGGLAAVFVPFLNILSMSILLVLIGVYDAIAVWRTKHMISMAQFQAKLKVFAGLLIPYGRNKTAILGGGDIGFPLLFSGVMLKTYGWMEGVLVSVVVTGALFFLLVKSEKNRYYPAMPFLGAGCFIGLLIVWVLQLLG